METGKERTIVLTKEYGNGQEEKKKKREIVRSILEI